MKWHLAVVAVVGTALAPFSAHAGLNLGMKLACKRYGDAFTAGNQAGVVAASTGDFGYQFRRMPREVFSRLPRASGSQVIATTKNDGVGTVTVNTSQGRLTFVLVGSGFNWSVADIYKPNEDGNVVSLKNYLDATLTANEFMVRLKRVGGSSFHASVTQEFRQQFERLNAAELDRIRASLPDPKLSINPNVQLGADRATMRVRVPNGGPNDAIRFELERGDGWKVADFALETGATSIPSFAKALPLLAGIATFNEFVQHPDQVPPQRFTVDGNLRDVLEDARKITPFPLSAPTARRRFEVTPDGSRATIVCVDRTVRFTLGKDDGEMPRLASIELRNGGGWTDVAGLLALQSRMRAVAKTDGGVTTWIAGVFGYNGNNAKPKSPSVLENALAIEPVKDPVASADGNRTPAAPLPTATARTTPPKPLPAPVTNAAVAAVPPPKRANPTVYPSNNSVIRTVGYNVHASQLNKRDLRRVRRGWR